ncbi:MAG: hypothetical protein ACREP9_09060 [Candidatus Dormibacteraceae bacterium]
MRLFQPTLRWLSRLGRTRILITGVVSVVTVALAVSLPLTLTGGSMESASGESSPSSTSATVPPTVSLPSDGWKPGDPQEQAIMSGKFHAIVNASGACAWIGSRSFNFLWPAGYRLRTDPVQLLAPDGTVVANNGDTLQVGGGGTASVTVSACGSTAMPGWLVQGQVTVIR